jgi:hypothetical protein
VRTKGPSPGLLFLDKVLGSLSKCLPAWTLISQLLKHPVGLPAPQRPGLAYLSPDQISGLSAQQPCQESPFICVLLVRKIIFLGVGSDKYTLFLKRFLLPAGRVKSRKEAISCALVSQDFLSRWQPGNPVSAHAPRHIHLWCSMLPVPHFLPGRTEAARPEESGAWRIVWAHGTRGPCSTPAGPGQRYISHGHATVACEGQVTAPTKPGAPWQEPLVSGAGGRGGPRCLEAGLSL